MVLVLAKNATLFRIFGIGSVSFRLNQILLLGYFRYLLAELI